MNVSRILFTNFPEGDAVRRILFPVELAMQGRFGLLSSVTLVLLFIHYGRCWDNEELELFDLVEEVNRNFYEVLGVEQVKLMGDK